MIDVERLKAIMNAHKMSQHEFARRVNLSQPKIFKVLKGEQTLTSEAVGVLINDFGISPGWLFGREGDASKPEYTKDMVPRVELQQKEQKIYDLEKELMDVYRQLAEERRTKYGQSGSISTEE
ncbi:helix-turn-helix domain-containing protein [Telluribacter humicola]|uniref:helix-turn-helix domain-containing protein n=1 Tax=Telluribacter humicola TaxID=1720261 RepID=UPI001A956626|nr:helix-turn-helix transcriptional regulator [Telluribacter humicola]